MSTMTEREGKHEQETDSNDSNSGNGRSRIRSSRWTSWRPPFPWRPPLPSCSSPSSRFPSPPSSPSPLRMGNRCCGNRNSSHRARYRSSAARCCRSRSYGCNPGSCRCCPCTCCCACSCGSPCACSCPADNRIQVVNVQSYRTAHSQSENRLRMCGFLVRFA